MSNTFNARDQILQIGTIFSDELFRMDVRSFEAAEWKEFVSPIREKFGAMGVDILEWIVTEIKKQNRDYGLSDDDTGLFDRIAEDIGKGFASYEIAILSEFPSCDQNAHLFLIRFKDYVIMPALFPKVRVRPPSRPSPSTPASPSKPPSKKRPHLKLVPKD